MVTWYWSADNLIWLVSIDHNMMSYQKVHSKPKLYVSVNLLFGEWPASCAVAVAVLRRRPRAIPLAMITMRKSGHGFPVVSYMGMELSLAALRAAGVPLKTW